MPEDTYFDGFDIPTADIDIVKNGRLESFLVDFYIARKLGLPQTGRFRTSRSISATTPLRVWPFEIRDRAGGTKKFRTRPDVPQQILQVDR